MMCEENINQT